MPRLAGVDCGPGAILRLLGEHVGPSGRAVGVDGDPSAVSMAQEEVAGLPHAGAQLGQADDTSLEAGTYDVVMCRHVLAHNGGRELAIVSHRASLASPGGCVYLVDIDASALRVRYEERELLDLQQRYYEFQSSRGNDLSVGLRLGDLLTDAGLTVGRFACRAPVLRMPSAARSPAWAARMDMIADGFASEDDVERWEAAFRRMDRAERRPWLFAANFVAIGRR